MLLLYKQSNTLHVSLTKATSQIWYMYLDLASKDVFLLYLHSLAFPRLKLLYYYFSCTCVKVVHLPQNNTVIFRTKNSWSTWWMPIYYTSSFIEPPHDGCSSVVGKMKSLSNCSISHPWSIQKTQLRMSFSKLNLEAMMNVLLLFAITIALKPLIMLKIE